MGQSTSAPDNKRPRLEDRTDGHSDDDDDDSSTPHGLRAALKQLEREGGGAQPVFRIEPPTAAGARTVVRVDWDALKRYCYFPILKRTKRLANAEHRPRTEDKEAEEADQGYYCEEKAEGSEKDLILPFPSGLSRFGGVDPLLPSTPSSSASSSASKEETWPKCVHCQRPMIFFFQLYAADLPPISEDDRLLDLFSSELAKQEEEEEEGEEEGRLLQCFHCENHCSEDLHSSETEVRVLTVAPLLSTKSSLKRLAAKAVLQHNLLRKSRRGKRNDGNTREEEAAEEEEEEEEECDESGLPEEITTFLKQVERTMPFLQNRNEEEEVKKEEEEAGEEEPRAPKELAIFFDEWALVGWRKCADYPTEELLRMMLAASCPDLDAYRDESWTLAQPSPQKKTAAEGSKLGGWPCWYHFANPYVPKCPLCKAEMTNHFFQMVGEDSIVLPYHWDMDCGSCLMYQCNTHKDQFVLDRYDPTGA
ncbi:RPGR [Balamuthia mandrillaris]